MTEHRTHFHVGIVVADIEAARRRLTELMGVTWGPVLRMPEVEVRDGDGVDGVLPSTICYSVGEPAIELIEEVPGTVWSRNPHSNLHHIGFWSDDLHTEIADLVGAGCPIQLCGRLGDQAPWSYAYHGVDDLGIRVELLDVGMRPFMTGLFEPDPTAD